MSWERIAEAKIRELIESGALDDLPNRGRPLDLDDYFKVPAEQRMAYSVLKSAGVLPEEVALLNEIEALPEGQERERVRLKLALLRERRIRRTGSSRA